MHMKYNNKKAIYKRIKERRGYDKNPLPEIGAPRITSEASSQLRQEQEKRNSLIARSQNWRKVIR
ncbi:hypothetical protein K9L16_00995 [Candidatus Pacearchaeota archaeon]|nr:hypothetical protein [Candidatus Pacearchaeota archaeon]